MQNRSEFTLDGVRINLISSIDAMIDNINDNADALKIGKDQLGIAKIRRHVARLIEMLDFARNLVKNPNTKPLDLVAINLHLTNIKQQNPLAKMPIKRVVVNKVTPSQPVSSASLFGVAEKKDNVDITRGRRRHRPGF